MEPTDNDVLSGRGAWYNQHPGNQRFRKMLDEQKDTYMAGTKKQKMDISKAIVEAIHSMDPPGRFLKECPDTGQWMELSKRDAADKAAQAMSYAISGRKKSKQRRERRQQLRRSESLTTEDDHANVMDDIQTSQSDDPQTQQHRHIHSLRNDSECDQPLSVAHGHKEDGAHDERADAATLAAENTSHDVKPALRRDHVDPTPTVDVNPQTQTRTQSQQLIGSSLQASSPSSLNNRNHNHNQLAHVLAQALQQQRHQEQHDNNMILLEQLQQPSTNQLSPTLCEGLSQLLIQMQHRQNQQQQLIQQRHLLIQLLLLSNQQMNVLPPASYPPALSSSLMSSQCDNHGNHSINTYHHHEQQPQMPRQSDPSHDASLLNALNNTPNRLNNNLGLSPNNNLMQPHQHQQLSTSLLRASSMNIMSQQQQQLQQSLSLDSLRQAWQTALYPQLTNPQSLQHHNAQPPVATNAGVLTTEDGDDKVEEKSDSDEEEESS